MITISNMQNFGMKFDQLQKTIEQQWGQRY